MTEQMNKQWSNVREEQEKPTRLLLADFIVIVRQYVMEVTQTQNGVQQAYEVFSDQSDIWSDECDSLLTSLHSMNDSVHNLYKLLEETEHLPSDIVPLRYQLVAELRTAEERIHKLDQLARAFRPTLLVVSNQAVKLHYAIICGLEALLQACENIVLRSQFLFDQARFLERY